MVCFSLRNSYGKLGTLLTVYPYPRIVGYYRGVPHFFPPNSRAKKVADWFSITFPWLAITSDQGNIKFPKLANTWSHLYRSLDFWRIALEIPQACVPLNSLTMLLEELDGKISVRRHELLKTEADLRRGRGTFLLLLRMINRCACRHVSMMMCFNI